MFTNLVYFFANLKDNCVFLNSFNGLYVIVKIWCLKFYIDANSINDKKKLALQKFVEYNVRNILLNLHEFVIEFITIYLSTVKLSTQNWSIFKLF